MGQIINGIAVHLYILSKLALEGRNVFGDGQLVLFSVRLTLQE
jgi:hypothetical protein